MKCILIDQAASGQSARLMDMAPEQWPDAESGGEVAVRVAHSSINYKDGLAMTGRLPVVRRFPMVPGIDLAGEVMESADSRWRPGDQVVLNGWGVGETHWGGLAQYARLRADWLVPLPAGLTTRQAMLIGTAGYTAMLCLLALERHGVKPADGPVLVTGASGGVGSVAIMLLSRAGYTVVASSGRPQQSAYLQDLGASEIIARQELAEPGKPLAKERWAAVVDSVGSHTLANACATTRYGGAVAACGLAGGMDFPATVAPFILRGVTLYGIDSVMAPSALRRTAWDRLARDLDLGALEQAAHEISLAEAIQAGADILDGKLRGRTVVDVNR